MLVSRKLLNNFINLTDITDQDIVDNLISLGIDFEKIVLIDPDKDVYLFAGQLMKYNKTKTPNQFVCHFKTKKNDEVRVLVKDIKEKIIKSIVNKKLILFSRNEFKKDIDAKIATYNNFNISYYQGSDFIVLDDNIALDHQIQLSDFQDTIFIFTVPSNRPDLNAVAILCKELAIKLNRKFILNKNLISSLHSEKPKLKVSIETRVCKEASYRLLNFEKNNISNFNLRLLLLNNDIKPNNLISDIVTLSVFIGGCPLQVYDFDQISPELRITYQSTSKQLLTDKGEINLKNGVVINNQNTTIALAGISLNKNIQASIKTKRFLIEHLCLDSTVIKKYFLSHNKTSNLMNTKVFAYRFHAELTNKILNFYIDKLCKHYQLFLSSTFYFQNQKPKKFQNKSININLSDAKKIINLDLNEKLLIETFRKLDFKIKKPNLTSDLLIFIVPEHRLDLENKNDIIEEIVRFLIDLNKVPLKQPEYYFLENKSTLEETIFKKSIDFWLANNFIETINYSLISNNAQNINLFNFHKPLVLKNENIKKHYRLSFFYSLFETLIFNLSNKISLINFFEFGDIYFQNKQGLIKKNIILSTISCGEFITTFYPKTMQKIDVFYLKSLLMRYFKLLNIDLEKITLKQFSSTTPLFNKQFQSFFKNGVFIYYYKNLIGCISEVLVSDFLTSKPLLFKNQVIFSELNLTKILNLWTKAKPKLFIPISTFPRVERDFSFFVDLNNEKNVNGAEILNKITMELKRKLKFKFQIKIIDFYHKPNEKIVSYSVRVTFENDDKTFLKDEISKLINVVSNALSSLNYKLR